MADESRVVSRERVISAPPERIFELLADPRRHPDIDGSGSVKHAATNAPERLSLGAKFGMGMRLGVPYRMVNTVVEYEENRRIAWAPKFELLGREMGAMTGRIWRYDLEPVDGGTRVTETWDATRERSFAFEKMMGITKQVGSSLDKTLERIASIVEGAPAT
jgi:uncharacterized protein YndB with AHSA1/START domain